MTDREPKKERRTPPSQRRGGADPRATPTEPALRVFMRRLREILDEPGDGQSRLDKIVRQIAGRPTTVRLLDERRACGGRGVLADVGVVLGVLLGEALDGAFLFEEVGLPVSVARNCSLAMPPAGAVVTLAAPSSPRGFLLSSLACAPGRIRTCAPPLRRPGPIVIRGHSAHGCVWFALSVLVLSLRSPVVRPTSRTTDRRVRPPVKIRRSWPLGWVVLSDVSRGPQGAPSPLRSLVGPTSPARPRSGRLRPRSRHGRRGGRGPAPGRGAPLRVPHG